MDASLVPKTYPSNDICVDAGLRHLPPLTPLRLRPCFLESPRPPSCHLFVFRTRLCASTCYGSVFDIRQKLCHNFSELFAGHRHRHPCSIFQNFPDAGGATSFTCSTPFTPHPSHATPLAMEMEMDRSQHKGGQQF